MKEKKEENKLRKKDQQVQNMDVFYSEDDKWTDALYFVVTVL